jgi:hypothetical protein
MSHKYLIAIKEHSLGRVITQSLLLLKDFTWFHKEVLKVNQKQCSHWKISFISQLERIMEKEGLLLVYHWCLIIMEHRLLEDSNRVKIWIAFWRMERLNWKA